MLYMSADHTVFKTAQKVLHLNLAARLQSSAGCIDYMKAAYGSAYSYICWFLSCQLTY